MHTPVLAARLSAAALTVGLLGTAGVAHAAVTEKADPRGDGRNAVDIASVRVDHADSTVHVRITPTRNHFWGDFNSVYLDTNPRRAGAEFRAEVNSEGGGVFEVRRWRADGRPGAVTCPSLQVDVDDPVLRVHIPRRCIDNPAKVRVRVVSDSDLGRGDRVGWTSWVHRG